MFQKIKNAFDTDSTRRELQKISSIIDQINAYENDLEQLSDEALKGKTQDFRNLLAAGKTLDDILPEVFATVREASKRTIGLRHYDVQMIGGMVLHQGKIAEMKTGEGKTLVATLPLYLNALAGHGTHLVTVNDYLARRDARWMAPIYHALGLSVGVLQMAARTENGQKAFLVDFSVQATHEDQQQLRMVERVEAYRADITYGTNSEFGFDYLRDNLAQRLADRSQRGHFYAIVDEVDNILIDEARTPLIISGPAQDEAEWYIKTAQVVRQLRPEDYEVSEKDKSVSLTEIGEAHIEEILGTSLRDPDRPEDITPEQARMLGYLEQSLRAQFLFRRNKDYLVQAGKVIIVDEFTGRLMPGRRWSEGLHQAVEAKEGVKVEPENVTYATITLQNYFRMYRKLAGMTGTAWTEKEEFFKIYRLDIVPIPTNLEYVASHSGSELVVLDDRDEEGYKFQFYSKREDPERKPAYWKRKDFPDVVYRTEEAKLRAITLEILRYHIIGRPQLVGTTSVEHSERLSDRLNAEPLRRLVQTVMIREAWLAANPNAASERDHAELKFLNQPLDKLNTSEMRNFARGVGIPSMNPDDSENVKRLLSILRLGETDTPRLINAVQGGVQHQVLNARKHDEEAVIIARAGAFGAVTIATNMAGRGVDIKLGGQLRDDILQDVIHVLAKAGFEPYEKSIEELRQMVDGLNKEQVGIYEDSVKAFHQYLEEMERVRVLGGLHVVGSERHEARRIDNQLRGRSARQGDPGSSRFYLSLEDELMRLFGGGRAENLMSMFNIDPSIPIESGMLGRLVEQAQERVEGSNFDIRKHLLEYDDVLNQQRNRIYGERDKVFSKDDLQEDVLDMLRIEIKRRVPEAMQDEEGPWKLLAYLEEIQPTMYFEQEGVLVPSFPLTQVLVELKKITGEKPDAKKLKTGLQEIAQQALQTEKDHLMRSARQLIDKTDEALENQLREHIDILDTFFDGLGESGEGVEQRKPQELLEELSTMVRVPLRLSGDPYRDFPMGSVDAKEALRKQIESSLLGTSVTRMVGAFERRLDESLELKPAELVDQDWAVIADTLIHAVEQKFDRRMERIAGGSGEIAANLDNLISRTQGKLSSDEDLLLALMAMSHGIRAQIDQRTHQRGWRRVVLLNYFFLASQEFQNWSADETIEKIVNHLENSQKTLHALWGRMEFDRLVQTSATLPLMDVAARSHFEHVLGKEKVEAYALTACAEIPTEDGDAVRSILGWKVQNEIYRSILLGAISELWVDYLTRIEAVRVSIGLEAYAQRDPLVQYKGKASELFKNLLTDIRIAVLSRMYLLQPRRINTPSATVPANATVKESPVPTLGSADTPQSKKKHRHRH
jgi:preprotein translocase subunit SecA